MCKPLNRTQAISCAAPLLLAFLSMGCPPHTRITKAQPGIQIRLRSPYYHPCLGDTCKPTHLLVFDGGALTANLSGPCECLQPRAVIRSLLRADTTFLLVLFADTVPGETDCLKSFECCTVNYGFQVSGIHSHVCRLAVVVAEFFCLCAGQEDVWCREFGINIRGGLDTTIIIVDTSRHSGYDQWDQ